MSMANKRIIQGLLNRRRAHKGFYGGFKPSSNARITSTTHEHIVKFIFANKPPIAN